MIMVKTKCSKKKYTELMASFALSQIWKQGFTNWKRQEKRKYFCKECNAWHLTSQSLKS